MRASARLTSPSVPLQLALVLVSALVLRAAIAWVWWPQSGFFMDLDLNADWVRVLTTGGWDSFYRPGAPYFIDYPPVYFVVLSAVGWLSDAWVSVTGGGPIVVALLKAPPILADVATAALAAAIAGRAIGPRAAVPSAALVAFNPAVIFDSAVYGQNDSVGAMVVAAGLYAAIRHQTEIASALAVLATLVKFQFGFFIPIVLAVGLRRHLGPGASPVRVLTSAAAALVTMAVVLAPFRLALYDAGEPARSLWHRFTGASEAFSGVTQNAFNLWMNPAFDVLHIDTSGGTSGSIVDDTVVVVTVLGFDITWQLLGGLLFMAAVALAVRLLARKDDAVAIMVAAFVVAVALYMFPTRIHERYLVPALMIGAPLVMQRSRGWPIVYVTLSAVAFFSMYFVYTLPALNRHLVRDPAVGATLLSPAGIYLISFAGVVATAWLVWQAYRMGSTPVPAESTDVAAAPATATTIRRADAESNPAAPAPVAPLVPVAPMAPTPPVARTVQRAGTKVPRSRTAPRWLTFATIVAVSFGAALVAARVSFGTSGWLWGLDIPKIHFPLAAFYHEALAEGRLPLWHDRLGMGYPLYAEGQIGAFYPPSWLIFQLDPLAAMDVTRVLHLTLAGVGVGLLALRVSGSRHGALVATVVAVLGGAIVTKLEWWNLVAAYAWLPWVLLPLAGWSPPSRRALVLAGVLWGLQALAGHPNTWLLTGLAALVLLVRRPLPAAAVRVAVFGALGAAVGGVQLIPTLMLQRVSARSLGLSADDLFTSASTPFDLLGLGFVNAFIRYDSDGSWNFSSTWYPDGIFALLEAGLYVGLPAVALAALGVTTRRSRRWVVLGIVAVAIGVIAAFRPKWWEAMPILNGLRSPVRSYLLLTVAIAVVAAVGVARLGRDQGGARRGLTAMGVVIGAYVIAVVAARSFPALFQWLLTISASNMNPQGAAENHGRAVAAFSALWPLVLELAAAGAMAVVLSARRTALSVSAAVLVVAVPLVLLSPLANPLRDRTALDYSQSTFVTTLAAQSPQRVLTIRPPGFYSGMPDQLAAAGIADVDMFSSLNLLENDLLVRRLREQDADRFLQRAVGVDTVVAFEEPCTGRRVADVPDQRATICRVDDALSPPYWIPADAIRGTEPDLERVLSESRGVTVTRDEITSLELTVEEADAGLVYVDRAAWFAWQAAVDGEEVAARPAMGGQVIAVPAGSHVVALSFVPWDAVLGLSVGVIALGVALGWLWLERRGRPSGEPVYGGSPHAPGIHEESNGERDRGLEADQPPDPVRGQQQQERVEVLSISVSELGATGIRVQQHRSEDGQDRRPAPDDEPRA